MRHLAILGLLLVASAAAEQPVVNLESTVTGNQEQPKVMYIMPWQAPDGPDSLYQDFDSQMGSLFDPVERDSFVREMNMNKRIYEGAGQPNPE